MHEYELGRRHPLFGRTSCFFLLPHEKKGRLSHTPAGWLGMRWCKKLKIAVSPRLLSARVLNAATLMRAVATNSCGVQHPLYIRHQAISAPWWLLKWLIVDRDGERERRCVLY